MRQWWKKHFYATEIKKASWFEQSKRQGGRAVVQRREPSFLQQLPKVRTCLAAPVRKKTQNLGRDTEPRADTEGSETGPWEVEPREVKPAASTNQQPSTQIVLPRHTSVSGMDSSFIRYYWEYGMTPYLMESLMTKRGWTLQMINKVIKNCNSAWKTSVAPVQNIRYNDEIDTDEELGPMPCTEDNTGAAAATVTSETLYIEGEPSVQTGLEARAVTAPKRGGGRGTPVPVACKEPRKPQGGREVDRERAEEEGTQQDQPDYGHMTKQGVPQRVTKRKQRYRPGTLALREDQTLSEKD